MDPRVIVLKSEYAAGNEGINFGVIELFEGLFWCNNLALTP
jgi:hypothetical protein